MPDEQFDGDRTRQVADALGVAPDLKAITEAVLSRTLLSRDDERQAMLDVVKRLLEGEHAWRWLVADVVPPPTLRDQVFASVEHALLGGFSPRRTSV